MNVTARIESVQNAPSLDFSITGITPFYLSNLIYPKKQTFDLPTNLRLGHLIEKIVGELIKNTTNFELLFENIQVIKDKKTIGELDFIVRDKFLNKLIHVELAYKFYLFDPSIPGETIHKWIGPNRKDALKSKLEKLKRKQFPLLFDERTEMILKDIKDEPKEQALCFLVSLYVPLNYDLSLLPNYRHAIKGYYTTLDAFLATNEKGKLYYLPIKKEWGIEPNNNQNWNSRKELVDKMHKSIEEKQSFLCWQKQNNSYTSFFIVWWPI